MASKVVLDHFSHWVEATPSKDVRAETVVKFLSREVIARFHIPSEITSDNGSAFIQKIVKAVFQRLRIQQCLGAVYHPQDQGVREFSVT